MKTIFVPLAACQEYYLEHTIKSAIANAEFPERIHFGVFNQILNNKYSLLDREFVNYDNVVYVEVVSKHPLGVGAGRMNSQLLAKQDHDFLFQTDAHTIFTKNWDSILIDQYEKVSAEQGTDKIVFSGAQAGGFYSDPEDREFLIFQHPKLGRVSADLFYENNFHEDKSLTISKAEFKFIKFDSFTFPWFTQAEEETETNEINGVAGTFMFAPYSLLDDALHDPRDPYNGDQTNYSLRLLSRGYKIFIPVYPAMFSMGRFDTDQKPLDLEYHWSAGFFNLDRYQFMLDKYYKRLDDIQSGKYLGYWGAPDMESLTYAKNKMGYPDL